MRERPCEATSKKLSAKEAKPRKAGRLKPHHSMYIYICILDRMSSSRSTLTNLCNATHSLLDLFYGLVVHW